MGIFSKFAKAYRVYKSETYRETTKSVERLAGASLRLFAEKSAQDKAQILERVTELSGRLHNAIGAEIPVVVALALLTTIRTYDTLLAADR